MEIRKSNLSPEITIVGFYRVYQPTKIIRYDHEHIHIILMTNIKKYTLLVSCFFFRNIQLLEQPSKQILYSFRSVKLNIYGRSVWDT